MPLKSAALQWHVNNCDVHSQKGISSRLTPAAVCSMHLSLGILRRLQMTCYKVIGDPTPSFKILRLLLRRLPIYDKVEVNEISSQPDPMFHAKGIVEGACVMKPTRTSTEDVLPYRPRAEPHNRKKSDGPLQFKTNLVSSVVCLAGWVQKQ